MIRTKKFKSHNYVEWIAPIFLSLIVYAIGFPQDDNLIDKEIKKIKSNLASKTNKTFQSKIEELENHIDSLDYSLGSESRSVRVFQCGKSVANLNFHNTYF